MMKVWCECTVKQTYQDAVELYFEWSDWAYNVNNIRLYNFGENENTNR